MGWLIGGGRPRVRWFIGGGVVVMRIAAAEAVAGVVAWSNF